MAVTIHGHNISQGTEFVTNEEPEKKYVVSEITEDGDIIYLSERAYRKFTAGLSYSNPQKVTVEEFEKAFAGFAS